MGSLRFRHGAEIRAIAFAPDGKTIASAGEDHLVRHWDLATGMEIRQFQGHADEVEVVAFSPDGKFLASGSWDQTVRLWEAATGKQIRQLTPRSKYAYPPSHFVAFSPDGRTLALREDDKTIALWETATGEKIHALTGHSDDVLHVAFSPDGKTLLSGSRDKSIRLWDPTTGKQLRRLDFANPVWSFAVSPDGTTVLVAGDTSLWDLATGKELPALQGKEIHTGAVSFTPDGKRFGSLIGFDGTVGLWDVVTGKKMVEISDHRFAGASFYGAPTQAIAFSPDGKIVAIAGWNKMIRFWDVATGKEVRHFAGHQDKVADLAFLADGRTLATCSPDRSIRFWELATGMEIRRIDGHERQIYKLAVSPDGKLLASGGTTLLDANDMFTSSEVRLWEAATGKAIRLFEGREGTIESLVFSPDGKTLASGDAEGGTLCLWDVATGKRLALVKHENCHLTAYSPDGRTLATASGGNLISLRDATTAKELGRLAGEEAKSYIRFTPDGRLLICGSSQGLVRIWNVAKGVELGHFEIADGSDVFALSPNGKLLAAASDKDRTIVLWELATGQERCRFQGHRGSVCSLAFSSDGKFLASGAKDNTALVWAVLGLDSRKLSTQELAGAWADLASGDASRAHAAISQMCRSPEQSLALLRDRLHPVRPLDPRRVARLLANLDSEQFYVREEANEELEKCGEAAEAGLKQALAANPSLEVRRRIERLLERLRPWPNRSMQGLRAIEVLEHIGTPQAQEVLKALAEGIPEARLTREAKASLERLSMATPSK